MSKRKDAERQAALAREQEQSDRMALFAFEARMNAREEQDQARRQEFLLAAKQDLARDRLEAEAADLDVYRATAVAQATSAKTIAPEFVGFINATSREEIDQQIERAKVATQEILAEIGQTATAPSRDERTGRFLPQAPQPTVPGQRGLPAGMTQEEYAAAENGTLDMNTYTRMRDRLQIGHRDTGIFG